uniref:T-box domain-containing protein n=1 Tax=Seriola dumerili TaxID=41447 RepID=A0A3B4VH07_SERDU
MFFCLILLSFFHFFAILYYVVFSCFLPYYTMSFFSHFRPLYAIINPVTCPINTAAELFTCLFVFVSTDSKSNLSMPRSPPAADSYQQGCIRMTLENASLWKSFHSIGTEMIITKHGRRMFPHCSISLSGLQPFVSYVIMMDLVPVDRAVGGRREGRAPTPMSDIHAPRLPCHRKSLDEAVVVFPQSEAHQQHLGSIILHSMHRYYPRFHVIQADSPYTVRWGPFQTFSFPETTFTAVTAYQNPKITKLKIDHNPFAKGFREGGTHSHSKSSELLFHVCDTFICLPLCILKLSLFIQNNLSFNVLFSHRCRSNRSPPVKRATLDRKALCSSPPGKFLPIELPVPTLLVLLLVNFDPKTLKKKMKKCCYYEKTTN